MWGGILVIVAIWVMWALFDRRPKTESYEEDDSDVEDIIKPRHDKESWTLDSTEDTAHDHEGE